MNKLVKSPAKHYSPLRYPGGKASLASFLGELIAVNNIQNCTYVEPYAGGAGAALSLLFLEKVDNILLNDLDRAIYSFWTCALTETDRFIEKISSVDLTIQEWRNQKEIYRNPKSNTFDLGFATFYLNRTNRSGIIEAGPIGGVNQTGKWLIDARFNREELGERINRIGSYRSRITVTNKDGIDLIRDIYKKTNHFTYLDPPYYMKGSSLYLNFYRKENHERLAKFLNKHPNFHWILTYDNVTEIKDLYLSRRCYDFDLNYHIDLPKLGKEVLVVSNKVIIPEAN